MPTTIKREQIRDYVAAGMGAITGVGLVRVGRTDDADESDLPLIDIMTNSETSSRQGSDGGLLHLLSLDIRLSARSNGDIYATLDPIAGDIEGFFEGDQTLGGLAFWSHLSSVAYSFVEDRPLAAVTMTYQIGYYTE